MTATEVRAVATECLDKIAKERPGAAYAGIRGRVAGVQNFVRERNLILRRYEDGSVRLEIWPHNHGRRGKMEVHPLPADLALRAVAVLAKV